MEKLKNATGNVQKVRLQKLQQVDNLVLGVKERVARMGNVSQAMRVVASRLDALEVAQNASSSQAAVDDLTSKLKYLNFEVKGLVTKSQELFNRSSLVETNAHGRVGSLEEEHRNDVQHATIERQGLRDRIKEVADNQAGMQAKLDEVSEDAVAAVSRVLGKMSVLEQAVEDTLDIIDDIRANHSELLDSTVQFVKDKVALAMSNMTTAGT